jgi:hypothetical protein
VLSFLVSATGCVVLYAAMKAVRVYDLPVGRYGKLGISLIIFFLVGVAVGRLARRAESSRRSRLAAVGIGAALIGIAAGVVFWNTLEDYVFIHMGAYPIYQERRLFPADVAMLWMYAFLPILAGVFTGMTTAKRT